MTSVAFNTLKYAQTLRQAGIEEKQAEALAIAQQEAFVEVLGQCRGYQD